MQNNPTRKQSLQVPARPLIPELAAMVGDQSLVQKRPMTSLFEEYWILEDAFAEDPIGMLLVRDGGVAGIMLRNGKAVPNVSTQPEAHAWIEQRVKNVGQMPPSPAKPGDAPAPGDGGAGAGDAGE